MRGHVANFGPGGWGNDRGWRNDRGVWRNCGGWGNRRRLLSFLFFSGLFGVGGFLGEGVRRQKARHQ